MKKPLLSTLALAIALLWFTNGADAQDKIVRNFTGSPKTTRLDACSAVKKEAEYWAEDEVRKPFALALIDGRRWQAEIDGYSDCDCEKSRTVTGDEWKCSVDAKIRAKR